MNTYLIQQAKGAVSEFLFLMIFVRIVIFLLTLMFDQLVGNTHSWSNFTWDGRT